MKQLMNTSEFGDGMSRKHRNKGFSEEPLPELLKVPLNQEQIDATRDPADILADKYANENLKSIEKKKK